MKSLYMGNTRSEWVPEDERGLREGERAIFANGRHNGEATDTCRRWCNTGEGITVVVSKALQCNT